MKKILIAEDTDSNFLLLSIILRKKYDVIRAINGKETVDMFKSEKPDMILMDIKMPIMDGLTATSEIRRTDKNIPIIALTANAYDSDREKAYEVGCNNYMAKPILTNKLLEMIDSYFK